MRKKAFLALMLTLTIISSSGCQTEIKPADPKDGKYATQTSMTSLEYALYMNKQITVFTNQLSTRMAVAANHKDVQSSNESYMTQQSIETLQDTLDEVTVTKPSKEKDDSREAVMTAMETAIEHLKSYKSDLDEGTFSSAAAKEMKTRYQKKFGMDAVTFSTIHSMCMSILKKFGGYTKESILSDPREYFYEVLRKQKGINDINEFITGLITEISVINNNSIDLNSYKPKCTKDKKLFLKLINGYQEYKEELHLIDFDDMLQKAYEIMVNDKECLDFLRNKYRYIQVDEYQDTNLIQKDIIYLLAGQEGNLAVVGDDDQSIYAFRGAKPEIMLNFQKEYPKSKMVKMSTNYRSGKKIISEADRVIKSNTNRFQKDFIGFKPENGAVEYIVTEEKKDEILKIYSRIKKLLNDGENPADIAVLFRTNRQAEKMAAILFRNQIPFQSNEKIQSKYEHWMFQDLQAYYRLANKHLDNKSSDARRDLSRVLNHPNRYLFGYDYIVHGLNRRAMKATVYAKEKEPWKLNAAEGNIDLFFMLLKNLRGKKPSDFLRSLYSIGKYKKYLEDYADFRNMEVRDLSSIWKEYQHDASTYNDWVEWGKYIVKYNKELKETLKNKDGIMLSTMHGSKGLEWKHVFIIDCVEGVCPSPKAETAEELEEERRLFYVAMTRAKEHLYLCYYKAEEGKTVVASPYIM